MSAETAPTGPDDARRAEPVVLDLEPHPAAVARARAFVTERCRAAGVTADDCDTVVLLASEVVTNAVLHGRSVARLTTTVTTATPGTGAGAPAATVRVEVSDDNSRHPIAPGADPDALDGRGIAIVDLLSTAWGTRDEPLGKTVWFELRTGLAGSGPPGG